MHQAGGAVNGLHQVGLDSVFEQGGHGALGLQIPGGDGGASKGTSHHQVAQAALQVVQIGGQAEHGHHFRSGGDIKAVLTGHAVALAAQTGGDLAQLAIVHVQAAAPQHLPGINTQLVALLDVVVHHGSQQVVSAGDGVQVAGKMQINVLHGQHLGVTAAGGAALHAEHRAQGGLAQGQHGLLAQHGHAVGQTHRYGGLALTGRGGVDGRYQHQLGAGGLVLIGDGIHLGHITAIGGEGFF